MRIRNPNMPRPPVGGTNRPPRYDGVGDGPRRPPIGGGMGNQPKGGGVAGLGGFNPRKPMAMGGTVQTRPKGSSPRPGEKPFSPGMPKLPRIKMAMGGMTLRPGDVTNKLPRARGGPGGPTNALPRAPGGPGGPTNALPRAKMRDGGMTARKGYADGGMPMVMKDGKKVPSFAADGKGKMKHGGMAHGKAPKGRGMAIMIAIGKPKGRGKS